LDVSHGAKSNQSPARLLAEALSGAWRTSPEPLNLSEEDLARITPQLLDSGAAGLLWPRARLSNLKDSPAGLSLRQAYRFQTLQSALQEQEIKQVFARLREAGVEPILVKGWAIARSYAEKGLRPSGDIDLLIRPSEIAAAAAVLKDTTPHQFNVDLKHREFAKLDGDSLEKLWDRSRLVQTIIRVLAPEDHLVFLCLHMLRHGAWRPLWLCDIAAALESRPSGFDWRVCLGGNRRQSGWVASAIKLAHDLVGADLHDTPFAGSATPLPGWLPREVLKQWENPNPMERMALDYRAPLARSLTRPAYLAGEIRARWPNPIEATISVGGPLNGLPRFPFQIGNGLVRLARFMAGPGRQVPRYGRGLSGAGDASE
jgi:hypothetical protein